MASAISSSSASAVLPSKLQPFPVVLQQMIATYLPIGDICALSRACTSLFKSIKRTNILETARMQKEMVVYRSPAPVLRKKGQTSTIYNVDQKISTLAAKLKQIRQEPQAAAAAASRNPAEEIAIEKALNVLRESRLPTNQISKRAIDLVMSFLDNPARTIRFTLPEFPLRAFDAKQWNTFIGEVPNSPLSPEIEALLRQPCSIFPSKTKSETHLCVEIPPTVDGAPLTLNRILHFAEVNHGNKIHVNIEWNRILQELGDTPIPADLYILLKTCLPDTKNKTHLEQLQVLAEHPEYSEASLMQVLVGALMEHIQSGKAKTRLFDGEYARTSTTVDDWRLDFGGVGSAWPDVSNYGGDCARGNVCLAVVLRSGGSSPALGT